MKYIDFIGDEYKDKRNIASHNVSFEEAIKMRSEYDFSNAKSNPYIKKLRKMMGLSDK